MDGLVNDEKAREKKLKLMNLTPSETDWRYVKHFTGILNVSSVCIGPHYALPSSIQVPDSVQQSFSAEKFPSLHKVLPALEAVHSEWSKMAGLSKFDRFKPALQAGITKIETYYERTSFSSAYIFSMGNYWNCLDSSD